MKYLRTRFALIILMILLFLGISLITRIILMLSDLGSIDFGLLAITKVFSVGFAYDFISSLYFLAPLVLYITLIPDKLFNNRFQKYLFLFLIFFQINLLVFNSFAEWFFWDEFGKRFNFIAVDYLVYTHEVINNIVESYPIPLLLGSVFIISACIFYLICKKTSILVFAFASSQRFTQRLRTAMCLFLIPFLSFFLLNEQSLANISANQFNVELSKNGLYSLFSAFRNNTLDYETNYRNENTERMMSHLKTLYKFDNNFFRNIKKTGVENKYNVILIMVESLSAEYIGAFGDGRGWTPNLDNLAKNSLFFDNFYATGTRTTRGMEAVTLSIPPTPGRSIIKRPDCHNMFSSGFIFKEKGYENKFIYAGHGYFDNMNDFFSHNGFLKIDQSDMDSNEITFSNVWGVCDEDLFNKVLKESDKSYQKNKPFFNYVMTTSNHRPYTYPDGKIDIPSHTGRSGGVKYTDYAIHKFLAAAAAKPWFKNTIFVIVADHNGGSAGETSLPVNRYKVPLLIYGPGLIKSKIISKLSSQIDLMPTLFSILNWSYESKFYGDDILDDNFSERAFIGTYQKLGFLRKDRLVILEPDKTVNEYRIVHQDLHEAEYEKIDSVEKDVTDTITYYQSASYFYKSGINRWEH
ncbi:MAG: LTA synthase family protein [Deltaproteobacteria bacterium]|nr:LTA synthase family protein [Deltaproteobacteria bacterium]